MEDKITPTVQLGGRMWVLKMTHGVLMRFSSITKLPMDRLISQIGRYDYMVLLLWLMCLAEDPTLKKETFEGWLDELGIAGVMPLITAVGEAMKAAFPEPEEAAEDESGEDGQDPT